MSRAPKTKTQAEKKAEADEKNRLRAEEREAEGAARAEAKRKEGLALAAAAESLKVDKKAQKKAAAAAAAAKRKAEAAAAAASAPLLPSASSIAHATEDGIAPAAPPDPSTVPRAQAERAEDEDAELGDDGSTEAERIVEAAAKMKIVPDGRIVLNHSTHIEGMLWLVRKLSTLVSTIIPGAISGGQTNVPKLTVRFRSAAAAGSDGGSTTALNFLARNGCASQDLVIVPTAGTTREQIEAALEEILDPSSSSAAASSSSGSSSSSSSLGGPLANLNRVAAAAAADAHRTKDQAKVAQQKEAAKQKAHEKKVAEKAKKLNGKVDKNNLEAYAELWVDWEKKK